MLFGTLREKVSKRLQSNVEPKEVLELPNIQANQILNCQGMACPMPIVKTKSAMGRLEGSQIIEVQATIRLGYKYPDYDAVISRYTENIYLTSFR